MDTMTIQKKTVALDRARPPVRSEDQVGDRERPPHPFHSILFPNPNDRVAGEATEAPEFFADLNCGQIVDAITAGKEEYNLRPFFYGTLGRVDAVKYRQEVMQDLENAAVLQCVRSFAQKMHDMRDRLARVQKLYYKEHKQAWFLAAIDFYCEAINAFTFDLSGAELKSRGFLGFSDYLTHYARSTRFTTLVSETNKRKEALATVKYCVLIHGDKFTVRKYDGETDYSVDVEQTFEKFKQGAVNDYRVKFRENDDMNHIEAKILEFVAKLYPEVFGPLDEYCIRHANYLDQTVAAFDREIQFYLAYID
jgi:DNA mismatch repair protein MutS